MKVVTPSFSIEGDIDGARILHNIERAGRTAYKSRSAYTQDTAKKFVAGIIRQGHESVLEHESITVRVICDRGVSHEIVRHRIASYTQESTRYCDYSKPGELTFIQPLYFDPARVMNISAYHDEDTIELAVSRRKYAMELWKRSMQGAEDTYLELREHGWSPQEARAVLPNSLKTEIVMTMNLREWRHFFRLRASTSAHPQMREIARPLLVEFRRLIPVVFDDTGYMGSWVSGYVGEQSS